MQDDKLNSNSGGGDVVVTGSELDFTMLRDHTDLTVLKPLSERIDEDVHPSKVIEASS